MDWTDRFTWALGRARFSTAHRPAHVAAPTTRRHAHSRRLLDRRRPLSKRNPAAHPRADSLGFEASLSAGRFAPPPFLPGRLRCGAAARSCLLEAARYARQFPFRISVALTRVLASPCNLAPPPLRLPAKSACFHSVFGRCGRFCFHLVIELIDLMAGPLFLTPPNRSIRLEESLHLAFLGYGCVL